MRKVIYITTVITGLVVQFFIVPEMIEKRGYITFGGEYLIMPLMILITYVCCNVYDVYKNYIRKDDDNDEANKNTDKV